MEHRILIVEDEYIVADHLKRFLQKAGHQVCGIAASYDEALLLIDEHEPSWVLLDITLNGSKSGIDLGMELSAADIPFIYLSANMNQQILEEVKQTHPYGFMAKPFKDKQLMMMLDIAMDRHKSIMEAREIAGVARQSNKFEDSRGYIDKIQRNSLIEDQPASTVETKLIQLADALHSYVHFDLLCVSADKQRKILKNDFYISRSGEQEEYTIMSCTEMGRQFGLTVHEYSNLRTVYQRESKASLSTEVAFKKLRMDWPLLKFLSTGYDLESQLSYPLQLNEAMPVLTFFSRDFRGFKEEDLDELENLKDTITANLAAIFEEEKPRKILVQENGNTSIQTRNGGSGRGRSSMRLSTDTSTPVLSGIIGSSPALLAVFEQLQIVAPTATSVLIMGESGTGKERIAQAVHELSPRKGKPFVIVNCAALPMALIESELFGHEKGAFTGAADKRIGKFEQADGGTIFLDEIGELPMESQVKLLRVLQEKEIERVGGNQRKKVDVRIIAATNRNMEKEVAEGRFRLDLYYRLNVFPLELPPLRKRHQDLPQLISFFTSRFAKMLGKDKITVSPAAMNKMLAYSWPGNIRELSHVLERAVLLAQAGVIAEVTLPKSADARQIEPEAPHYIKSFDENERDHILYVLKKCFGRVAGTGGAAEMLRVPPTTLTSKIKRLGIMKKHFSPDE
jgi:DNA-binding NtrC family response regulator